MSLVGDQGGEDRRIGANVRGYGGQGLYRLSSSAGQRQEKGK